MRYLKVGFVAAILAVLVLTACNPSGVIPVSPLASSDVSLVQSPSTTNGTFNGALFQWNGTLTTTTALNTKYATEYGLWVSCSGLNMTQFYYQISPNNVLWSNGTTTLQACKDNSTYYNIAAAGGQYLRFVINGTNDTNASRWPSSLSNLTIILSTK